MKNEFNHASAAMRKSLFVVIALVVVAMFGCKEKPYIQGPGESNPQIPDTIPTAVGPMPTPDPEGADVPAGCLDVYQALSICKKLKADETTEDKLYVKGWIYELDSKYHENGMSGYGNATFYIAPTNDGSANQFSIEAYQVNGRNGQRFTSLEQVKVGDFVVIYGQFTNYNNKVYETVGRGAAYVYYSNNPNF